MEPKSAFLTNNNPYGPTTPAGYANMDDTIYNYLYNPQKGYAATVAGNPNYNGVNTNLSNINTSGVASGNNSMYYVDQQGIQTLKPSISEDVNFNKALTTAGLDANGNPIAQDTTSWKDNLTVGAAVASPIISGLAGYYGYQLGKEQNKVANKVAKRERDLANREIDIANRRQEAYNKALGVDKSYGTAANIK